MRAFQTIAITARRGSATAASIGSSILDRTATLLRRAAGETSGEPAPEATPGRESTVRAVEPPRPTAAGTPKPAPRPARPAQRRISNPKAAKAVRKRQNATNVTTLEVTGDSHHGGHPVTVVAENTRSERARAKAGRQAAPMGARDDS